MELENAKEEDRREESWATNGMARFDPSRYNDPATIRPVCWHGSRLRHHCKQSYGMWSFSGLLIHLRGLTIASGGGGFRSLYSCTSGMIRRALGGWEQGWCIKNTQEELREDSIKKLRQIGELREMKAHTETWETEIENRGCVRIADSRLSRSSTQLAVCAAPDRVAQ